MSEFAKGVAAGWIVTASIFSVSWHMRLRDTQTQICSEIEWHSPTCDKIKQERLNP